jgi:hypothetical protein
VLTLHVHPIVLWRESTAHCECACDAGRWTVRLCVDTGTTDERVVEGVGPMLRLAQVWRQPFIHDLQEAAPDRAPADGDRRRKPRERRAFARGGRRRGERYRSHVDTAALVTEIAGLREENALLRDAAVTFGGLAERLNTRLRTRES